VAHSSEGSSPTAAAPVQWPAGPPTDALAEILRTLELTVVRKLDGFLHGQYQGITPGHGSEIGESRMYQVGDDVRRIDWNVTARTNEPHVRVDLAERVLVTWLVLDTSVSMQFGTADRRKADVAEGVALAVRVLIAGGDPSVTDPHRPSVT